jgi:hypothetical protein
MPLVCTSEYKKIESEWDAAKEEVNDYYDRWMLILIQMGFAITAGVKIFESTMSLRREKSFGELFFDSLIETTIDLLPGVKSLKAFTKLSRTSKPLAGAVEVIEAYTKSGAKLAVQEALKESDLPNIDETSLSEMANQYAFISRTIVYIMTERKKWFDTLRKFYDSDYRCMEGIVKAGLHDKPVLPEDFVNDYAHVFAYGLFARYFKDYETFYIPGNPADYRKYHQAMSKVSEYDPHRKAIYSRYGAPRLGLPKIGNYQDMVERWGVKVEKVQDAKEVFSLKAT